MGVLALNAFTELALIFFNNFPLFLLMLRMKDPQRLPGQYVIAET